jgi:hypothetical protein
MASAAIRPAKIPALTLFSGVQKRRWLGASGGTAFGEMKFCPCAMAAKRKIAKNNFMMDSSVAGRYKKVIAHTRKDMTKNRRSGAL